MSITTAARPPESGRAKPCRSGVAEAAGIDDWIVDLDGLAPAVLAERALALRRSADDVRAVLAESAPRLRALSSTTTDAMLALLEESEGRAAQVAVWELATARRLRAGASDSWSSIAGQDGVRDADVHVSLGVATVDVEDSSFAE